MKLKSITESDLLGLLEKKTIQEQYVFLNENGLIHTRTSICNHCTGITSHDESLADLAERLWRKAVALTKPDNKELMWMAMITVSDNDDLQYLKDDPYELLNVGEWFLYYARPIHRIVAALIALKRAGVE